jgi:hypothetical protein
MGGEPGGGFISDLKALFFYGCVNDGAEKYVDIGASQLSYSTHPRCVVKSCPAQT